jgi:hypothetical protein
MSLVGFKITNHPQQVGKRGASDTVDERITPAKVFDPLQAEFSLHWMQPLTSATRGLRTSTT